MGSSEDNVNKASSIYSKTKDISDIEKIVDKILQDNENKSKAIESKSKTNENLFVSDSTRSQEINAGYFSPEKKKKESIYYLRKKSNENGSESEKNPDDKVKRRMHFGKTKNTIFDESTLKKKEKKKLAKDYDEKVKRTRLDGHGIFSRGDSSLKPEDVNDGEVKWLNDTIKKTPSDSKANIVVGTADEKINELTKKHLPSDKKAIPAIETKKEKKEISVSEKTILEEQSPLDKKILPKDEKTNEKVDVSSDLGRDKPAPSSFEDEGDIKQSILDEGFKKSVENRQTASLVFEKNASSLSKPESIEVKPTHVKTKGNDHFSKYVLHLKSNALTTLGFAGNEWEEMGFYPLNEPFAYVELIRNKENLGKRYVLIEVRLSKEEVRILKFLRETLSFWTTDTAEMESKSIEVCLREKVEQILQEYKIQLNKSSKEKVIYYLEKSYLGLGKIDALMKDPDIEDISCDGAGIPVFLYHRSYGSLKSNIEFKDEEKLASFVVRLAQKCGKHISISEPMLDATMPDGSRIQMTLSTEVTARGSTFTIRKFKEDPFSPPDLIEFNSMSSEMVAYMWMAVENGVNALIAGGTAAGKTSTLNALCLFIPRESKIVSIEETREINLPHPNWIPGVARSGFGEIVADKMVGEIDMYDLMKAALRQRPEYILVGEIRGKEAYVLFQAMATGHTTYSTAHADSAQSLIHRLEGKPIDIPRIMLQALDIVCIQVTTRVKNKRARRCRQIIEIIDIDPTTKEILTNEVFRWDPIEDSFMYSGKSYVLENIRAEKDMSREKMTDEIKNRAKLLEWMNNKNMRDFREVATFISRYAEDPTGVMNEVGGT